jgi:hypothetical protein
LRALEKAVSNGIRDRTTIDNDPDLEGLRKEPAYMRLLEIIE